MDSESFWKRWVLTPTNLGILAGALAGAGILLVLLTDLYSLASLMIIVALAIVIVWNLSD